MELVENSAVLDRVGRNAQTIQLVGTTEVEVPKYILLPVHAPQKIQYSHNTIYIIVPKCFILPQFVPPFPQSHLKIKHMFNDGIQIIIMEEDHFKNPFEIDDENLQMIKLDQSNPAKGASKTNTYVMAPQPAPQPQSSKQSERMNVSEASMFDLLGSSHAPQQKTYSELHNGDEDPPLLEDIGIDLEMIKKRITAIISFEQANEQLVSSPDLSGPVLISLLLGFLLLLGGKIHFSDIETGFIFGTVLLYIFFNFMNRTPESIPLYNVMSFLGYSLIPMLLLAVLGIFTSLTGELGLVSGLVLAGWSSYSCSNLFAVMLNREDSKMLIMYPLFLFYVSFAMIIIY